MAQKPTTAAGARPADANATPNPSPADRTQTTTPPAGETTTPATPPQPDNPPPAPTDFVVGAPSTAAAPGLTGLADENEGKIEFETTGNFMLQDPYTLEVVEAHGTSKVTPTTFILEAETRGQLKRASA